MAFELRAHLNAADQARADAVLRQLETKSRNPSGGLRIVGEALLREQNHRFASQTAPDGSKWKPLSPLTVMLRGAPGPILRRSGALMASGNYQVGGSTLRVGINAVYAGVQQFGAKIEPKKASVLAIPMGARRGGRNGPGFVFAKRVTIPPRPVVGFGARDEIAARRAVDQWLKTES